MFVTAKNSTSNRHIDMTGNSVSFTLIPNQDSHFVSTCQLCRIVAEFQLENLHFPGCQSFALEKLLSLYFYLPVYFQQVGLKRRYKYKLLKTATYNNCGKCPAPTSKITSIVT